MSTARPKLLFVLSHDYGELFNALYFAAGAPFSVVFVLPPKLHQANERTLAVPAYSYRSAADVSAVVARERPDLVVLFSGYLLVINKLLTQDEVGRLLDAWRSQGLPVVTSDPSLGLISGGSAGLFQAGFPGAPLLGPHFDWLAAGLTEAFHVYLAPLGVDTARRHGSYFNPRHVLDAKELARRAAMLATWSAVDRTRRRWLFVISPEDDALQAAALGRAMFAKHLAERLRDAASAGRQAVLIAPPECLAAVREAGLAPADFIGLSACGYLRFMLLLYDAEYVFYWNLFSASMLARVMNRQPIFTFAPGHLVQALRRIRDLGARHFYLGEEPASLALHAALDAKRLDGLAHSQQLRLLAPVSRYLAQSPTPEQLVATILEGRIGA